MVKILLPVDLSPANMAALARSAGAWRDCLKMNYVLMKTTELQMLWKLVKAGEDRPLSAVDLALLLRIRFALQEYEAKSGQGSRRGEA
jgi:hypothetical protein